MESLVIIFVSTLLFHSSDAGSFTWLHSDDTVNFVEGETAKLNWSVRIGAGKTWLSVKITRKNENVGGGQGVDMIRRKPSGVDILLANRTADMDLDVQFNSNVLSVSFSLGNLSRRADEMYYRITVVDDDTDSSWKYMKLNVYVPSSCKIHPNATTVNETGNVELIVNTTGNPPVNDYNWTHPDGSRPPGITDRWTFTASRQDTGTYKVSVYNGVGAWSYCTSHVTVQFPPTAVTPSLVRIKNLKNVSLQCSAQGKPEPTYSWTSTTNKTLQIRDNGKTVVLINATLEDSGRYTCTAKNSLGVSSSTSNVVVQYPVGCSISPDLQPIVVNESDWVNLTCNTKGNPPVNQFSWTYPNGTTLPGTSVLQCRASRMDISIYNCFVRNIFNDSGNCTRKVSVQFKPVLVNISLVKDPKAMVREENGMIIANETDSFNLTCESHANPVATYKWTVPDTSLLSELNHQTLVVNNVTRNHKGRYVCTASNVVGEISTSKNLSVNYVPEHTAIKILPNKTTFCHGEQIQVNCSSASAKPQANYSLYQNDKPISNSRSGYFLVDLNKSGNITITCIPSNEAGVGENISVRLAVEEPPAISNCTKIINNTYLAYGAVSEKDNVKLTCNISGSKPMNVSWRYGSKVWYQEYLKLPSINRKDAGTYEIRFKSGGVCNQTAKRNMTLEVYYPPDRITCSNKTVLEGENVQLVCSANGNPPPNVMWRRNGNIRVMGSTLLIKGVTKSDDGKYTFLANNSLGHETEDIFITVKYLDHLVLIGSSNKSYSQSNPVVLFNLSVNAYPSNASLSCYPSVPNILTVITSYDAGINTKQYFVFVVINNDEDRASIVCKVNNGVGVRETTLHIYRRPIIFKETFGGEFRITNQEWQDEFKDSKSTGYNDLKKKCSKILQAAYDGIPYLASINIKEFVKGSIIVRFELEVIGQVPDPLLPLRDYIKEQGGDINGLRIDYNSIQKSSDLKDNKPPPTTEENKTLVAVLGALLALTIVLIILLIGVIIWLRRKDSKGNSGKRSNKSDERGQMNDISLQETSFTATDNATPNVPEYEPIGRRGLATSNAGIPQYETVTTRTQLPQPQSGVQTNNPMSQYESADEHGQAGAVVNPPPVTYQTIQPRTGDYGSLSPLTRLPPKDTVLSSTGSPARTGEYQALQHRGVSPQYQSLDDLSKC